MTAHTKTLGQYVKDKTDEELIEEAKGLHDCINVADCCSSRDTILFDWVLRELELRGYEIDEEDTLSIKKEEDEDDN